MINLEGIQLAANIEQEIVEKLRGLPADQQAAVLKFVDDLVGPGSSSENGHPNPRVPIWDKIEAIMSDVPDEVLARIPTDGSVNVDHYLYGAPKKPR
jgi:hypothetical protein